jgi:hypothetical protein
MVDLEHAVSELPLGYVFPPADTTALITSAIKRFAADAHLETEMFREGLAIWKVRERAGRRTSFVEIRGVGLAEGHAFDLYVMPYAYEDRRTVKNGFVELTRKLPSAGVVKPRIKVLKVEEATGERLRRELERGLAAARRLRLSDVRHSRYPQVAADEDEAGRMASSA